MMSIFLIWVGGFGVTAWGDSSERAIVHLLEGEQRLFHVPGLKKYSLGGAEIRVLPTPDREEILVKAAHPGACDLWVWKSDDSREHRTILVHAWEGQKRHELVPLEHAVSLLQEVEVVPSAQGFILRGEVGSADEARRIAGLVQGFPKQVYDETEPAPALFEKGRASLTRALIAYPKLKLESDYPVLRVVGSLSRAMDRASVETRLRSAYPLVRLEIQSLADDAPTVHFKVFLLELKKNRFSSLGLSWPGSQAGAFHVSPWGINQSVALDLALETLEGEGSARILSNPELVVRAPGEAELFSGGEIPIRTMTHFSSQVGWKPYGLTLKLKVDSVTDEKVRLDIITEVSHLDQKRSNDNLPMVNSNRMKTQVDATFGSPLLLSGLLQQETRKEARGLPGLRDIPILGLLFGSEDYLQERSELVAILLPEARPPADAMSRLHERRSPLGPEPPPRNALSPLEEERLRRDAGFPWVALE